jgi:thiol-disulfide isomerase/thioredoxin
VKKFFIIGVLVIFSLIIAVFYLNNKYTQIAVTMPAISAGGLGSSTEKIKVISNGESVDLNNHLVKDYVVVFDFYADWCGPCKILGPRVEELVNKYNNVLLRKVNIVNWGSAVAKQYKIQFVPNVRVYDKQGQMIGEPTPDYNKIAEYVGKARK